MSDHPWSIASDEVQLATWRAALIEAKGNITRARTALGIVHSHAYYLQKKFNLGEFAAQLRLEAGAVRVKSGEHKGAVMGRPRKSRPF